MQDFMQFGFSEEASELVNDFLDFGGTCMRPTGELYGISGGKCRKGSESEPAKKRSNLHMRAYIRLMKKAKERGKPADTSGYHSHHAFPSSIFTNKETADKHQVWLTHGEHFQTHHLIYQALKNRYGEKDQRTIKMGYAIARMATGKDNEKLSTKQYAAAMKVKGEAMRAKFADPEERKKQEEAIKKAWQDPVKRQRMIQGQIGKKDTEESKQNKREAQLLRYQNPEERKKTGEAGKGRRNTEETKQKMKEAAKNRYKDPEQRRIASEKAKQRKPISEETRARMKIAATARMEARRKAKEQG